MLSLLLPAFDHTNLQGLLQWIRWLLNACGLLSAFATHLAVKVLDGHLTSWLPFCRNCIWKCECPSLLMCASEATGIGYMDGNYASL